jgi:membrane carboxypeptidase/penicillin-binding protein PbpC
MISQFRIASRLRRCGAGVVVGTGLAVSLSLGFGTATANADVLDDLAQEYSLGAGAGKVSNLLKQALLLRSQGFIPKPADYEAIAAAVNRRPNQMALIEALSATVANQRSQQEKMAPQSQAPSAGFGINTEPWNPNSNPMIQDDPVFRTPGR